MDADVVSERSAVPERHPFVSQPEPPVFSRGDVRAGIAVIVVLAACGAPLALLWWFLAPRLALHVGETTISPIDAQPSQYIASDLAFVGVASGFAMVAAFVVWRIKRFRGPVVLLALAAGVVACDWVAWKLGEELGTSEVRRILLEAQTGEPLQIPVIHLRLTGFLYLPAVLAVVCYLIAAVAHQEPDLDTMPPPSQQSADVPR